MVALPFRFTVDDFKVLQEVLVEKITVVGRGRILVVSVVFTALWMLSLKKGQSVTQESLFVLMIVIWFLLDITGIFMIFLFMN